MVSFHIFAEESVGESAKNRFDSCENQFDIVLSRGANYFTVPTVLRGGMSWRSDFGKSDMRVD